MKLEQSFEVNAPLERVWEALIDVERVAPCLPGASVTGRNDDGSYNGEFKVKIGPTSAAYSGKLEMENVDADAHTATMQAAGTDKRGQGGAKATITSAVQPAGEGATKVEVATDYHITGRLARFGRGGMIEEISNRLLGEFSTNLQAMLTGDDKSDGTGAAADEKRSDAAVSEAADADAALEGATPVAEAAETSQAMPAAGDGATPGTETSGAGAAGTQGPVRPAEGQATPSSEPEPLSATALVGSVVWGRVKRNAIPLAALLVGFLAAISLLRRRSS